MARRDVEKTWPHGEDLATFLHDTLGAPGPAWTHTISMRTALICPWHWPCSEQEVRPETSRGPLQPK